MKKISDIGSLTQLTSHYIGSLRGRVDLSLTRHASRSDDVVSQQFAATN